MANTTEQVDMDAEPEVRDSFEEEGHLRRRALEKDEKEGAPPPVREEVQEGVDTDNAVQVVRGEADEQQQLPLLPVEVRTFEQYLIFFLLIYQF